MIPLRRKIRFHANLIISPNIQFQTEVDLLPVPSCSCSTERAPCWRLIYRLVSHLMSKRSETKCEEKKGPAVLSVVSFFLLCADIWPELTNKRRQFLFQQLESMQTLLSGILFHGGALFFCLRDICLFEGRKDEDLENKIPSCSTTNGPVTPSSRNTPNCDVKWSSIELTEWLLPLIDLPSLYSNLAFETNSSGFLDRESYSTYFAGILLCLWSREYVLTQVSPDNSFSFGTPAHRTSSPLLELTDRYTFRHTAIYFIPWFTYCLALKDDLKNDQPLGISEQELMTEKQPDSNLSNIELPPSTDLFSSLTARLPTPRNCPNVINLLLSSSSSANVQKQLLKSLWMASSIQMKRSPLCVNLNRQHQILLTRILYWDVDTFDHPCCMGGRVINELLQIMLDAQSSDRFIPLGIMLAESLFSPLRYFKDKLVAGHDFSKQRNPEPAHEFEEELISPSILPFVLTRLKFIWDTIQHVWGDGSCVSTSSHLAIAVTIISCSRIARELTRSLPLCDGDEVQHGLLVTILALIKVVASDVSLC